MKTEFKALRPGCGVAAVLGLLLLAGCASHPASPVEERTYAGAKVEKPLPVEPEANFYVVQKGDTLSRIAVAQKQSVKDLTAWNSLADPNKVEVGQRLRIVPPTEASAAVPAVAPASPVAEVRPVAPVSTLEAQPLNGGTAPVPPGANTDTFKREPKGGKQPWSEQALLSARAADEGVAVKPLAKPAPVAETKPAETATKAEAKVEVKPDVKPAVVQKSGPDWAWPSSGKVLKTFDGSGSKGVDIAGKLGDPVLAAGGGKVVYAGTGIRGYGKLVIIKHDGQFLSAYANNSQILVKEGQAVEKGQKIARIGKVDGGEPLLHFEIRRQGKPTDPVKFLPARE